jgi:glycosyltransferase involved in cell wall biosynthesis
MGKHLVLFVKSAELFLSNHQHLAKGARDQGLKVTILCPNDPHVGQIRAAGFTCETVTMSQESSNPVRIFFKLAGLWSILRRLKPDILHAFSEKPVLYSCLVGAHLKIPSIVNTVTETSNVPAMLRPFYRLAIRSSRIRFVFHNRDDHQRYIQQGWARPECAQIIPLTGVDTSLFGPPKTEPDLPVRILFSGRFLKNEGLLELVHACDRLRAEEIPFRLVLCGTLDFSQPGSLTAERWAEIESRPFVEYLGSRHDMHAVYHQIHIVCLPSYGDGISPVLMEAAACGRALVTTDLSGCREIVKEAENGFLAEARSVADLNLALRKLITDENLRIRFGQRSRELAVAYFEKSVVVEEGLRVYGEMLSAA